VPLQVLAVVADTTVLARRARIAVVKETMIAIN
jgi:hypothetical protein